MPKVAYSEAEKAQVREALLTKGLELLAKQGIQHTTVEQIYKAVGISRTFFYSFFPTKESLIIEALCLQQPRVLVYAQKLMDAPSLSWREAVTQFLYACCYGEKNGILILTIEEQQMLFRRLSHEAYRGRLCESWFVYKYKPDGHDCPQSDPGNNAAVCSRSG